MKQPIKEAFLILLCAGLLALCARVSAPAAPAAPAAAAVLSAESPVQEIDQATLKLIVAGDPHLLLDARPPDSYRAGHLPGALNLPAYEFDSYFPRVRHLFDAAQTVIVYCSSSSCQDADMLAGELQVQGIANLTLYRAGFAEWSETGNPVNSGEQP